MPVKILETGWEDRALPVKMKRPFRALFSCIFIAKKIASTTCESDLSKHQCPKISGVFSCVRACERHALQRC